MSETSQYLYFDTADPIKVLSDHENQVANYLKLRLRECEWPFGLGSTPQFESPVNHSTGIVSGKPKWPELPSPGVNEWINPTGASRFGRGLFLLPAKEMAPLYSLAYGQSWDCIGDPPSPTAENLVDLRLPGSFFTKVILQSPIQLDATISGGRRELWLVPVVDARFIDLHKQITPYDAAVTSTTTWSQIISRLSSASSSFTSVLAPSGTIGTEWLQPDPGYFSVVRSVAYAIDHVAASIGRRATFNPVFGEYNLRAPGAPVGANKRTLGETYNPHPDLSAEVMTEARRLYDYYDNNSFVEITKTPSTSGSSQSTPEVKSTYFFLSLGGTPTTTAVQELDGLSQAIADSASAWQAEQFHYSHLDGLNGVGASENGSIDYMWLKYDCSAQAPQSMVTEKAFETRFHQDINISQSPDLYRHKRELARIRLTQTIYAGGTSGTGIIDPKSNTKYDGEPEEVTFSLMDAAAQDIPSGTRVPCFFQSDSGWYMIQGQPGAPGTGASPWIKFRVLSPVGNRESGVWDCIVEQHRNTDSLPGWNEPSPITCGTLLQVHDSNNIFPDVVFSANVQVTKCVSEDPSAPSLWKAGSSGTAFWRTVENSCETITENRWEVETCSQTINDVRGELVGSCLKKVGQAGVPGNGTATIALSDTDYWNISQNPAVDFPMEFTDAPTEAAHCWELAVSNPAGLHAVEGSMLRVRRRSEKFTSLPINDDSPHGQGALVDPYWEVYMVEEDDYFNMGQYANWVYVELVDGSGGDLFGSNGSWNVIDWFEGQDPRVGSNAGDNCRPSIQCGFDCSCLTGGDRAFAFFDPNTHSYTIVSTDAALLGVPSDVPIMNSWAADAGCTFNWAEQTIRAFPCDNPIIPATDNLETVPLNVHTGVYRGDNNQLCFYTSEIQICDAIQQDDECVNACFPCDCDDYNCTFVYDENTGYWQPVEQCPENLPDCNCTGEAPTNTPLPGEPTTVTFPCGATPPANPCGACDECTEDPCTTGFELTDVIISGNCANGDRWQSDSASISVSYVENCCWDLEIDFIQPGTAFRITKTARVCLTYSGAIMNCSMNGYPELTFSWNNGGTLAPEGACFTLPTNMGASTPYCEGNYGLNGCGVLPTEPELGGSWDEVQAAVVCCVPQMTREESDRLLASAMGTHYIGGDFHTAELNAPPPKKKVSSPLSLGDAYVAANRAYFKGCGCKKDIVPVMNRWQRKAGEPSKKQVLNVATTLHGKQSTTIKSKITVDQLAVDIMTFVQHFYRENNNG
ncbi:MAG: hypothetical protein ACO23H_03220 [Alphaproteobacteria bacterium]